MPISQIKYKMVTKEALKPDTLSEFIKYIYDNLREGEAKKIANSIIGEHAPKAEMKLSVKTQWRLQRRPY